MGLPIKNEKGKVSLTELRSGHLGPRETPLLRRGRTGRGFGAKPHSMKARGHNAKSAHQ